MPARGRKKPAPVAEAVEQISDGYVKNSRVTRRGAINVKPDSENNDSKTEKRTTRRKKGAEKETGIQVEKQSDEPALIKETGPKQRTARGKLKKEETFESSSLPSNEDHAKNTVKRGKTIKSSKDEEDKTLQPTHKDTDKSTTVKRGRLSKKVVIEKTPSSDDSQRPTRKGRVDKIVIESAEEQHSSGMKPGLIANKKKNSHPEGEPPVIETDDNKNKSLSSSGRKRKLSSSHIVAQLDLDSPLKKVRVASPIKNSKKITPKKRFRSIASTLAKDGVVTQRAEPRKTLCNIDILGMLEDDEEEESATVEPNNFQNDEVEKEVSFKVQKSETSMTKKVPVWKMHDNSRGASNESSVKDIFDPNLYGEEEFGPEDKNVVKKKTKRKKKDTKAILTFGNKRGPDEIRNVVKMSHNLATPGTKKPRRNVKAKPFASNPAPPPQTTFDTDVSTGAHNYFDSEVHQEQSGIFGESLSAEQHQPSKSYQTPQIPKKFSRLQKDHDSSTPNKVSSSSVTSVQTVKDQIKNNFGFDSEEDLSESENTSLVISPVRKVANPVMAMMANDSIIRGEGAARLSTIPGVTAGAGLAMRRVDTAGHRHSSGLAIAPRLGSGPFRVNLGSRGNKPTVEQALMSKVREVRQKDLVQRKKEMKSRKESKRTSPRKGYRDPVASSTLLEDIAPTAPKRHQKSVYEMLHDAKNKREVSQSIAAEDSLSGSELSSLYDDIPANDDTGAATDQEETVNKVGCDKENTDINNPSPKKFPKPAVSRAYKGKNNKTALGASKNITVDRSEITSPIKKETKKDKELNEWAKLQTSQFDMIDDFDLSFT